MNIIYNYEVRELSHPRWGDFKVVTFNHENWVNVNDLCNNTCRTTIQSVLNTIDDHNVAYIGKYEDPDHLEPYANPQGILEAEFGRSRGFIDNICNWIKYEMMPIKLPTPDRIMLLAPMSLQPNTVVQLATQQPSPEASPKESFQPLDRPCNLVEFIALMQHHNIHTTDRTLINWLQQHHMISKAKRHCFHPLDFAIRKGWLLDTCKNFNSRHPEISLMITPQGQTYLYSHQSEWRLSK